MRKTFLTATPALITLLILITACQPIITKTNQTNKSQTPDITPEETPAGEPEEKTLPEETSEKEEKVSFEEEDAGLPKKIVTEGDLVSFPNLQATDPDGDPITYTFTPPLDENGEWQTQVGDAGKYKITITASDGKNEVSQDVIIIVEPKNKPPIISLPTKKIIVDEGERVDLNVKATDPDGDKVTLSFSGWMQSATKQTTYEDAGTYQVTITASDGKAQSEETVSITVNNVNRAPKIEPIPDVEVTEKDLVIIKPTVFDPDNDKITLSYSNPISSDGTWQTKRGDFGTYKITVTASDGELNDSVEFTLKVKSLNQQPVIEIAERVEVEETDKITLKPKITDPENDDLTITYSGWMNGPTYETTYDDAGTHYVTITASDGINTVEKEITIIVKDKNRPPQFTAGAFT